LATNIIALLKGAFRYVGVKGSVELQETVRMPTA
jgi:hypothetical protein